MDGQFHAENNHQAHNFQFDASTDRARRETDARRETRPVIRQAECGSGWYHDAAIASARADARHV